MPHAGTAAGSYGSIAAPGYPGAIGVAPRSSDDCVATWSSPAPRSLLLRPVNRSFGCLGVLGEALKSD
jgi:hypothetical protein